MLLDAHPLLLAHLIDLQLLRWRCGFCSLVMDREARASLIPVVVVAALLDLCRRPDVTHGNVAVTWPSMPHGSALSLLRVGVGALTLNLDRGGLRLLETFVNFPEPLVKTIFSVPRDVLIEAGFDGVGRSLTLFGGLVLLFGFAPPFWVNDSVD